MQDKDFKKLIDGFPEGVLVLQNDEIQYANPEMANLLDYSKNEAQSLKLNKIFRSEYRDTFIRMLNKFQTNKNSRLNKFKVSAITKNREEVWLQINLSSIKNDKEKYILGQVRKLSDQEYQNQSFAESPDFQQIIMDTIPVQVWYLIDENTYGSVNRAHAEFYGVDKKDMAFKNLEDIFPANVARTCREGNRKVFTTGEPLKNEELVPNHKNEEKLLSINKIPVKDSDGNVEYVVCSAKDITARKKARNKLIRVADWYKNLIQKTSAGIGISDFDENFILVNDSFASMLGYKNEELIGTNLKQLVDEETYKKFKDKSKKRKRGQGEVYEARIEKKDGTYLDAIIDASPYIDDYGEISGTVAVIHDISRMKQADKLMKAERDMSLKLTSASELEDVVKVVLESAIESTDMDSGGVYIITREQELKLIAHQGLSDEFVEAASYYGPDSKNTQLVLQGEHIYTEFDKIERDKNKSIENEGLKTFGLIPIKYRNDIIACLNIASHSQKTISDSTRFYIENLANRMGDSIARAQEVEKRKKKQQNFDIFFNTISDFLFILDQNGDIIYTNNAVKDKLGYSEEELQEKNVLQVHSPDRREEAGQIVQAMLEGKRKFCPVPLMTSSGKQIPVETKVVQGEWNGRKALFGISRDITERKKAEKEIRTVKQKLESFTQAIPDLAIILDEDGKYIEVMGSNKDLLYTSEENLIGKKLGEILPEDTSTRLENFIDKIIKTGTNQNIEYSLTINNKHRHFEARGLPYNDPNSGKIFIALIARDITNRKRMEIALQHSEKRFRDLVDLLPQTVFETDIDGKFTFVNRSGVETFGYSKQELINNMTALEVVISEQKEQVRNNIENILDSGDINEGEREYQLVKKDGSSFPALIDSATIYRNDEPVGMRGIVVDISRRKKAEEEVKAKYNLQKIVSEIVKEFILRSLEEVDEVVNQALGKIGNFLNVDRSYVFIFQENGKFMDNTHEWCAEGIEPQIENLKGLPSSTFPWWMEKLNRFENINIPEVEKLPERAKKEKEILQAQDIKSVFVSPLRVGNSLKGFVGFDAVENKRTWNEEVARHLHLIGDLIMGALERRDVKQELARSNQRMNLAKNAAGIGVWDIDILEKRVFWDEQMYELWGVEKDQEIDLDIYKDKLIPKDVDKFEKKLDATINENEQFEVEIRVKVRENEVRHLKSFGKVINNESGKPVRMIGVSWDITKTKELEKSLLKSKEEAEKAARSKSIFLGNMSHEIRTPLNAILGYAQIMDRNCGNCKKKTEGLTEIRKSGEYLLELIDDILMLIRSDDQDIVVNQDSFDLHKMISSLPKMFKNKIEGTSLNLKTYVDSDVPQYIKTDREKVRQVMINLLGNAIKYTETGSIQLQCLPGELDQKDEKEDDTDQFYIALKVSDTGVGIKEDQQERIFNLFVQAEEGQTIDKGTGLGLPLSKKYARAMGGDISVESTFGEGSTFTFTFKAQKGKKVKSPSKRIKTLKEDFKPARVLIVDDKKSNRTMLGKMLADIGFAPKLVRSGAKALDALKKKDKYPLVLLDLRMPEMDGRETLQKIRELKAGKNVTVFFITASMGGADDLSDTSADDIIEKPFKERQLLEKIKHATHIEYEYEYDKYTIEEEEQETKDHDQILKSIAQLPEPLITKMIKNINRGEIRKLRKKVEEVEEKDAATAKVISEMVDNYNYDGLLKLLNHSWEE